SVVVIFTLAAHRGVRAQADSTALYEWLYERSQKSRVTRWIYDAIFIPPEVNNAPPAPQTPQRRVNPVARYKGKIVRDVRITVTDPFGYTVDDTTSVPQAWIQRTGNKLH